MNDLALNCTQTAALPAPRWMLAKFAAAVANVSRARMVLTLGLMLAFALSEGFGITLLAPTLEAAGVEVGRQGAAGRCAALMDHALRRIGLRPSLLLLLGIVVVLLGTRSLTGMIEGREAYALERRFADAMRMRVYSAIANAGWLRLCRLASSSLIHALTDEIERVRNATFFMMRLAADCVTIMLYVLIAMALSPAITLLVLALGTLLALMLRARTAATHRAGERIVEQTRALYAATVEHMQSLKTAKAYGAEQRNLALFGALVDAVTGASNRAHRILLGSSFWFEFGSIAILGAAIYGALRIFAIGPAAILILLLVFARLMPRLMGAHANYQAFTSLVPSYADLLCLERQCLDAAEPERAEDGIEDFRLEQELALEHVSFAYAPDLSPALHDVTLPVPARRITAIAGASGAGKSTIADLMMGLLAPQSGRVLLDGVELTPARAASWRRQVGYVAQDTPIFRASVRDNLLWARPGATDAEIEEALRLAAAESFVARLRDGIDSVIDERGTSLSHGERQRIALARALLRAPRLLVLDEATNALDSETEARVLAAIEALRGKVTVVIIAHRASTIRCADLVYVIDRGTVTESGSWWELFARKGRLFQLTAPQAVSA